VALIRSARGTRSRLERIPNELRLLIINELPDVSSIINLALTGPDFYLFIEAQANNAANHVISTVGEELLPFAATLQGLDALGVTLPGPLVHDDSEPEPANPDRDPFEGFESRLYKPNPKFWLISTVLDRYINYRNMRSCHAPVQFPKISTAVHYMGFYKTSEYIDFHEVVEYWEQKLVSRALERAKSTFKVDASIEPTRSERTRFRKALYVLHLVSTAFPYIPIFESDEFYAWQRMWIPFAPWETEQVRCIHLLLADYFRDILSKRNAEIVIRRVSRHPLTFRSPRGTGPDHVPVSLYVHPHSGPEETACSRHPRAEERR
jgi:hypothetical protein